MDKKRISRRTFVKQSTVLAGTSSMALALPQQVFNNAEKESSVQLAWLGKTTPYKLPGVTWGLPWPQGQWKSSTPFAVKDEDGHAVAVDTWPLAFWPDGSLKWTAHALATQEKTSKTYTVIPNHATESPEGILVGHTTATINVDTGVLQATFPKEGQIMLASLIKKGKLVGRSGRMILRLQDRAEIADNLRLDVLHGRIGQTIVEQQGQQKVTIKVEGNYLLTDGRIAFPFILRFYFYKNSEAVNITHTFIFDGDEQRDFISGLGLCLNVPLTEQLHDRHIRFVGEDNGMFAEAVRGLSGLRRDPGDAVVEAQLAGKATPPLADFPENVAAKIQYIPAFGDYTLYQPSSSSFLIEKRTQEGHAWLKAGWGRRAAGTAYVGTPTGGMAFGIRDFWQSYPAQLDIRNAHTDEATITCWLWAPKAGCMDLRFYHDGLGQDTFVKQRDGLDITYEDYEPGFGTPKGVARTSELRLWAVDGTPSRDDLLAIARYNQDPPLLVANPAYFKQLEVFGGAFALPDDTDTVFSEQERQLAFFFDYYQKQRDIHDWYGFWDYGDVMHTYDPRRHVWRYDVGGFAWDNSELSTDLWLWYYFLRTGRKDVFRMAEAMTRHTGEVDVHHLGDFSPLGSRHNVQHWGCSAKQLRISTAANRRFYYYLTADERIGDLLQEQVEAVQTLINVVPGRKIGQKAARGRDMVSLSFGTDWGAVAAAWFTEWERTGNKAIGERLLNSMRTIAQQPRGFFTGIGEMDIHTGKFRIDKTGNISVSHLNASFGLPEICYEMLQSIEMPDFRSAWLQYCELYNAEEQEQQQILGRALGQLNLRQGHARLTAYAARMKKDPMLLKRACEEFDEGQGGIKLALLTTNIVTGPEVLNPTAENSLISTNAVAQWNLAAMQLQAFSNLK